MKQCTNEVLCMVRLRPIKTLSQKPVHNKIFSGLQLTPVLLANRRIT
ncbi:hypothetical protein ALQ67_01916 [Pseudomonas savastanoi pv. glycinea]|nr:hypothetical protein ALQ67_01916 [Pseudomonas savastanoi pv. glycinea]